MKRIWSSVLYLKKLMKLFMQKPQGKPQRATEVEVEKAKREADEALRRIREMAEESRIRIVDPIVRRPAEPVA